MVISKSSILTIVFTLMFFKTSILYPVKVLLNSPTVYGKLLLVYNIVLMGTFLLGVKKVSLFRLLSILMLTFYLLVPSIFLDNVNELFLTFSTFVKNVGIPLILLTFVDDFGKLYKHMQKVSHIMVVVLLFSVPLSLMPQTNYMEYGFSLSLCLVMVVGDYFIKKRKSFLKLFIICIAMIILFLFGNRGAFISAFFLLLASFLWSKQYHLIHKISLISVISSSIMLLYTFALQILTFLHFFIIRMGYHSYATQKYIRVMTEENDFSSGRLDIYDGAFEIILDSSFFPNGLTMFSTIHNVTYSHNFILDIFVSHGFLSILLITIIGLIFYRLILTRSRKDYMTLCFVFLTYSIIKLSMSSYLWYELPFWFSIIIALKCLTGDKSWTITKK